MNMTEPLRVVIENCLVKEKRSISVFHQVSKGSHLISHNGSVILHLQPVETGDYIHISVTIGPGRLKTGCLLELPMGMDFEFFGESKVALIYTGKRVRVKIPAGPPLWQLKVTRPAALTHQETICAEDLRIKIEEI